VRGEAGARGELDESAGCRRLGGGGGVVAARARLCRFPVWRLAGGVFIAGAWWVLGGALRQCLVACPRRKRRFDLW
jgi:hypothetical protein